MLGRTLHKDIVFSIDDAGEVAAEGSHCPPCMDREDSGSTGNAGGMGRRRTSVCKDLADPLVGHTEQRADIANRQAFLPQDLGCFPPCFHSGFGGFVSNAHRAMESLEELDDWCRRSDIDFDLADIDFVDVQHHRDRLSDCCFDLIEAFGLGEHAAERGHGNRPPLA